MQELKKLVRASFVVPPGLFVTALVATCSFSIVLQVSHSFPFVFVEPFVTPAVVASEFHSFLYRVALILAVAFAS